MIKYGVVYYVVRVVSGRRGTISKAGVLERPIVCVMVVLMDMPSFHHLVIFMSDR